MRIAEFRVRSQTGRGPRQSVGRPGGQVSAGHSFFFFVTRRFLFWRGVTARPAGPTDLPAGRQELAGPVHARPRPAGPKGVGRAREGPVGARELTEPDRATENWQADRPAGVLCRPCGALAHLVPPSGGSRRRLTSVALRALPWDWSSGGTTDKAMRIADFRLRNEGPIPEAIPHSAIRNPQSAHPSKMVIGPRSHDPRNSLALPQAGGILVGVGYDAPVRASVRYVLGRE